MFHSRISGRSEVFGSAHLVATMIAGRRRGLRRGCASRQIETVVVTGFKESLERALDMKRGALDSSDTILAEDIGKFPDLNLSESIQRIPGVALARNGGEGRQIQVRGLNSTFTRVRIDGMEAMSTVGGEDSQGGTNRTRAFDFNVFSSDLFNAITVHKSASADLEEGSLGATVDLHTAHPFDHDKFTLTAVGAEAGYADQNGGFNPRGRGPDRRSRNVGAPASSACCSPLPAARATRWKRASTRPAMRTTTRSSRPATASR